MDETFKPHKDFSCTREGNYQSYHLRVRVPYTYGDQLFRIYVFSWGEFWGFSINARSNQIKYPSREAATEAVLEALKETMSVLSSITIKDLMPEKDHAGPPENTPDFGCYTQVVGAQP